MPANLPEQAKAKWAQAQAAKDRKEKLRLLREFYSSFPKHKGTEKLEVSIKRQIKSLEEEVERAKRKRTGSSRLEWVVRKEQQVQTAVVSTLQTSTHLFNLLTRQDIKPHEILARPLVGVFEGAEVQFQVVLAPYDSSLGEGKQERMMNLVRGADCILIPVGLEPLAYFRRLLSWFEQHNIEILSSKLAAEIVKAPAGGIRLVGKSQRCSEREIVEFLQSYTVRNAVVKVLERATLDDVEAAVFGRTVKPSIFVTLDERGIHELQSFIPSELLYEAPFDSDELASLMLQRLGLIRVYTRASGEKVVERPLLLRGGSRVIDAAEDVHKDLAKFFRYARLWRRGLATIKVGPNFELEDGDVLEVRAA